MVYPAKEQPASGGSAAGLCDFCLRDSWIYVGPTGAAYCASDACYRRLKDEGWLPDDDDPRAAKKTWWCVSCGVECTVEELDAQDVCESCAEYVKGAWGVETSEIVWGGGHEKSSHVYDWKEGATVAKVEDDLEIIPANRS